MNFNISNSNFPELFISKAYELHEIFSQFTHTDETVKVADITVDYLAGVMTPFPDEVYTHQWKKFGILKTPVVTEDLVLGYGVEDYYSAIANGVAQLHVKKIHGMNKNEFMLFVCFGHYFNDKTKYSDMLEAINHVEPRLQEAIKEPWVKKLEGGDSRAKTAKLLHIGATTIHELKTIQKHDPTGLKRADKGDIGIKALYNSIKERLAFEDAEKKKMVKFDTEGTTIGSDTGEESEKSKGLFFDDNGMIASTDPKKVIIERLFGVRKFSRTLYDGTEVIVQITGEDKAVETSSDGTETELSYSYKISWDYKMKRVGSAKYFFISADHLHSFTFTCDDLYMFQK